MTQQHDPAAPVLETCAQGTLRETSQGSTVALELLRVEQTYRGVFAWAGGDDIRHDSDLAFLHASERAYYDGLRADRRRRSFLLGRLAAKRAIPNYLGGIRAPEVEIVSGIFGHLEAMRDQMTTEELQSIAALALSEPARCTALWRRAPKPS
jgi:hypothetical protein